MCPEEFKTDEVENGVDTTPLIELVKNGDVKAVRNYLQQHPSSVGQTDWNVSRSSPILKMCHGYLG